MTLKNKKITLISISSTQDADGFAINSESLAQVWAKIDSITGTEYSAAGQLSIQPSFRATVWAHEYNGQKLVNVDGKRYGVYRTYKRDTDNIELYLEEKAGVNS